MSSLAGANCTPGESVVPPPALQVRNGLVLPPLMFTVMDGDIPALKRMLEDPNVRSSLNSLKDSSGQTALHFAPNGTCVKMLCAAGANVFAQDSMGNTPLHAATERHNSGAVRELLNFAESSAVDAANARCINVQNIMGETALHVAVRKQNKPICTLICTYKPDFTLFVMSTVLFLPSE